MIGNWNVELGRMTPKNSEIDRPDNIDAAASRFSAEGARFQARCRSQPLDGSTIASGSGMGELRLDL
jgi:hypothetical protein